MTEVMIQTEKLSKRYRMYRRPAARLLEWATLGRSVHHQDFWALKDIDLEVRKGECVGIIGPNGAGKSTLLKILSGATVPNGGSFKVNGRVLSLLEDLAENQADGDVEQVAREIPVSLESGVLRHAFLVDRPPGAPRADVAVEAFEHLVLFRLRDEADEDRGGE